MDEHLHSIVDGKYRVVEFVGKGGMGSVYRAECLDTGGFVAVKFLHRHLISEPSAVKRFQQECHAARAISHHAIAAVLDYGLTEQAEPFLVMEFFDGLTLAELLQEKKRLPVIDVVEIARQICAALVVAHDKGIVHRDLKPSNIILQESEASLKVRLLDFGIAKMLPAQGETFMKVTMTGDRCGSLLYMSPEQCLEHDLDGRSDLYSLGCVMYEAITGTPAMAARTAFETMNKHLSEAPLPFASVASDIAGAAWVERIILTAMAKQPAGRFQNAGQMLDELNAGGTGTQVSTLGEVCIDKSGKLYAMLAPSFGFAIAGSIGAFVLISVVFSAIGAPAHYASAPLSSLFLKLAFTLIGVGCVLAMASLYIFGPSGRLNEWARREYVPALYKGEWIKQLSVLTKAKSEKSYYLGRLMYSLRRKSLFLSPEMRCSKPHMALIGTDKPARRALFVSFLRKELQSAECPVLVVDSSGLLSKDLFGQLGYARSDDELENDLVDAKAISGKIRRERLFACDVSEIPPVEEIFQQNLFVIATNSNNAKFDDCRMKDAVIEFLNHGKKVSIESDNFPVCRTFIDDCDTWLDDVLLNAMSESVDCVVSLSTMQFLELKARHILLSKVGSFCVFALLPLDAELLAPMMFRVDGRKIKHKTLQNFFNQVNTTPTFELIADELRMSIDWLIGLGPGTYYFFRSGGEPGPFYLSLPESIHR
ncbi:MAG: serine/threonine protein kinase [Candidatus Obscuribacterales bacterium]|nr:serine/threonine protein kinase [Candidatus Obscuribacterales bacterium]